MRALLLSPHHDDETLFASFLCIRYKPMVIVCFGRSEANGVETSVRTAETHAALGHLIGPSSWREWPLSDVSTTAEELEAWMIGLRDPAGADDWDIVFAPAVEPRRRPKGHGHPQHDLVGRLAKSVFEDVELRHYLTYTTPPLYRSRWGEEIEYEPEWLFRKHAALACYRSQAATLSYRHFAEDMKEYLA